MRIFTNAYSLQIYMENKSLDQIYIQKSFN